MYVAKDRCYCQSVMAVSDFSNEQAGKGAGVSRGVIFGGLLGGAFVLLVAVLAAGFLLPSPWSWSIGFLYIAYDTWLLSYMVRSSRRAVAGIAFRSELRQPDRLPSLAVLVAARNERVVLPETLASLLAQTYPAKQIVVIDDGSTDESVEWMTAHFELEFDGNFGRSHTHPSVAVLALEHGGKAVALNAALKTVDAEVVVTIDADTMLEPEALDAVASAFGREADLAAACGVLSPTCAPNWSSRAFELFQTFEYLRAFLWRLAWMREHTLVLVSGAFAAFRLSALRSVGGFDQTSRVEDYEVMFRLHRASLSSGKPLNVQVIGDARARTDSPGTPGAFLRQRTRWFAGFLDTMFRNRDMVGATQFLRFGTFHLPIKTFDMLLPVYGLGATATLVLLIVCGGTIDPIILAAVVLKFLFDVACYTWCIALYERWQGRRATLRLYARALAATLTEPLCFQFLRQTGAVLGWIAYVRGRIDWAPSRAQLVQGETVAQDAAGDV